MSVHPFPNNRRTTDGVDNSGGPPNDGDMEARVAKLEEFVVDARDRLTKIETRLESTATKADLQAEGSSLIKWVVGSAVGLGVAGLTVMTFVLNNAVPKPSQASSPASITINVPSLGQAPAVSPQAPPAAGSVAPANPAASAATPR